MTVSWRAVFFQRWELITSKLLWVNSPFKINFFRTANDPSHIVSWTFSDLFALSKDQAWIFVVLDPQPNSYSMIILFNVRYWWLKKGSLSNQGLYCLLSACTLAKIPESMWILCNYIQKQLNPNMWCLLSFSVERKRQREGLNFKSQNCRINNVGILWLTVFHFWGLLAAGIIYSVLWTHQWKIGMSAMYPCASVIPFLLRSLTTIRNME